MGSEKLGKDWTWRVPTRCVVLPAASWKCRYDHLGWRWRMADTWQGTDELMRAGDSSESLSSTGPLSRSVLADPVCCPALPVVLGSARGSYEFRGVGACLLDSRRQDGLESHEVLSSLSLSGKPTRACGVPRQISSKGCYMKGVVWPRSYPCRRRRRGARGVRGRERAGKKKPRHTHSHRKW